MIPFRCIAALLLTLSVSSPAFAAPPHPLASLPFRVHDNRILVDVMLDGHGPFTMVFDTGASNVITPECRQRLGLANDTSGTTSGAGEKVVDVGVVRVASAKFGAYEMRDQDFLVVDLGEIRRAFRFTRLDGIVGAELLAGVHARVDFDRARLVLTEPAGDSTYRPPGTMPIELENGLPVVEGRIEDRPARMLIDTGDRSNLTLFRKFAAGSGLDSTFAGKPDIPTGVGVGGPIRGRIRSIASVEFGPVHERGVVGRLPSTRAGIFATSPLAASIGLGLLRNYNLDIDYTNRYLAFEPRTTRQTSVFVPVPAPPR